MHHHVLKKREDRAAEDRGAVAGSQLLVTSTTMYLNHV